MLGSGPVPSGERAVGVHAGIGWNILKESRGVSQAGGDAGDLCKTPQDGQPLETSHGDNVEADCYCETKIENEGGSGQTTGSITPRNAGHLFPCGEFARTCPFELC